MLAIIKGQLWTQIWFFDGDEYGTKNSYPLSMRMMLGMNFYFRHGDEIVKCAPVPSRCYPYLGVIFFFSFIKKNPYVYKLC